MHSKSLSLVAAACLSSALASCGSGSAELARSAGGTVPGQGGAGWQRAIDNLNAAKSLAAETIALATLAPSAGAVERARNAADAYVKAAEAAVAAAESSPSSDGGNLQSSARSALSAAQSNRAASQRRLSALQEALGANPELGGGSDNGAGSGESAGSRLRSRLADLDARSLTHFERSYTFVSSGSSAELASVNPCSESGGGCTIGRIPYDAEQYLNPAFYTAFSPSLSTISSLSATPINGVEAFSAFEDSDRPIIGPGSSATGWTLLALGRHAAARLDLLGAFHYGVALGERHNGRPSDPEGGSATWRGPMIGAAMDNASPLAGESALTYSFGTNTADVRISGIRAIGDARYTGATSFTWTGLAVNSDGSFYIPGYNNDRSDVAVGDVASSSALHPTLGYIDGDFYGPNAEEAAGIFTRDNVNGAFVAGSSGRRTSADDETPSDGGQTPSDEKPPSEGGQAEQGGSGGGSGGSAGSPSLAQRLANLRSRSLTSLERGHGYRNREGSTVFDAIRCSESVGTCVIARSHQGGNRQLNPAFFSVDFATPLVAASINGVDAFSEYESSRPGPFDPLGISSHDWKLLALGQFSAARMSISRNLYRSGTLMDANSYGVALGERHGRPNEASGSATWRGQMIGAAMDNGNPLAGESALTYSFSANTVDVRISNIRAVGEVAPYTGSTSFTWTGLAVNSDGSFYIPGYNNDRSDLTLSSALHPTLGYIDGDFYGPNAEEAAGIFTRGNVNGAWLAKK